jgi:hypothetical protein
MSGEYLIDSAEHVPGPLPPNPALDDPAGTARLLDETRRTIEAGPPGGDVDER